MEDEDNVKEELDKEYDSPLFQAITRNKSANDIFAIIDRDPSAVRQRGANGNYPFHQACIYNDEDPHGLVILRLLDLFPQAAQEKPKWPTCKGYEDHYPLHIACRKLCDDVVLKLIEVYPNAVYLKNKERRIEYPLHVAYFRLSNPLHIACNHSRSDRVIMKLLEVFPEAAACRSVMFYDEYDTFRNTNKYHKYPLHIACEEGLSKEVIQKLVEIYPRALHERSSGPDGPFKDYPLGWAVEHNMPLDVIKLLVTTDPSILRQSDDNGLTPFHKACCNSNVNLVECLLQFPDLPINARTEDGETPLHFAGAEGVEAMIAMILDHPNIDVNAIDNHGNSTLHSIMFGRNFNLIHLMLSHPSIIIDQKDDKNQTPLDLINKKITEFTIRDDDDDYRKSYLHRLMEIRNMLQDFPTKRKWQSYEYFHHNFKDWSSRKRMKT